MKKLFLVVIGSITLFFCGCASTNVESEYVSPIQYSNYDCAQLKEELLRIGDQVNRKDSKLGDDVKKHNAKVVASTVFFWPALLFMDNPNNHKGELARLKGEYDAIEKEAVIKKCHFN